jgi:nucleotide-binding universal stress UspA family protein
LAQQLHYCVINSTFNPTREVAMKILFALDCCPGTEEIVGAVLDEAWPTHSQFLLFSAVGTEASAARAEASLTAAIFSFHDRGHAASYQIQETDDPAAAILELAGTLHPDLIIAGSRKRSNFARVLLGSVSTELLRKARCSVQIVRPRLHDYRVERCYRVMLATDGSASADKATKALAGRPWSEGTEVHVVSVIELIQPPTVSLVEPGEEGFPSFPGDYAAAQEFAHEVAIRALDQISPVVRHTSYETPTIANHVKDALLEVMEVWQPDLIFLGSHGIKGFDRILLGSVSEAIAIHANCSVEVVR